jgi:transposase
MVLQLANGEHPAAIALALGCNSSTVYRTRQAFLRVGEASLIPKKSPGRPRRVTAQQERKLDQALACEPRALGKNFSNWTAPNLKVHLHWTVHPLRSAMRRLKWRWRRPVPRGAFETRYSARARRGQIHLYYADEWMWRCCQPSAAVGCGKGNRLK